MVLPPSLKLARSKSACVSRWASSEVSGVSVEEFGFITVCLSHGDDPDGIVLLDMNDQHDQKIKQAHAIQSLLLVIGASVFKDHQWAGKDSPGIRKDEAVSRQIGQPKFIL